MNLRKSSAVFMLILLLGTVVASAYDKTDRQWAAYWARKGYSFDPNYMIAWAMDQAVRSKKYHRENKNAAPSYSGSSSYAVSGFSVGKSKKEHTVPGAYVQKR